MNYTDSYYLKTNIDLTSLIGTLLICCPCAASDHDIWILDKRFPCTSGSIVAPHLLRRAVQC